MIAGHIKTLIPVFIFWFLWRARNDGKYEGRVMASEEIIQKVKRWIVKVQQAIPSYKAEWVGNLEVARDWDIALKVKRRVDGKIVMWERPGMNWVKINTDGARNIMNGEASAAGIARDQDGRMIFGFQSYLGKVSILEAELMGIQLGLQEALEHRLENVIIESDSKVSLMLVQKRVKVSQWKLFPCLQKIKDYVESMSVVFMHVYREGNYAADFLANQALLS